MIWMGGRARKGRATTSEHMKPQRPDTRLQFIWDDVAHASTPLSLRSARTKLAGAHIFPVHPEGSRGSGEVEGGTTALQWPFSECKFV